MSKAPVTDPLAKPVEAASFTPGPWRVLQEGWKYQFIKAGDKTVAEVTLFGDESPHDARLIAAAPDLLEAAEELLKAQANYDITYGTSIGEKLQRAKDRLYDAQLELRMATMRARGQ